MYATHFARTRTARRPVVSQALASAFGVAIVMIAAVANAQVVDTNSIVRRISGPNEKLELTTNASRILTLDKNIPRVQVNNPELLVVTPLSANQVQISAKKAGVTQVNLWDENGDIHTVDVLIYGDARELEVALQTQFPNSAIKVYRYSESLVLKGFVDRPDYVSQIMRLAEDYAPKVINNISVGGVQQVLLKVKVMEVSRTKLRKLGVDWAYLGGSGDFAVNTVSDILSFDEAGDILTNNTDTFAFGIVDGNSQFLGAIDALQRNQVAKILAEPNIVAVSGRPAQLVSGGEFAYLVPQSLGTTTIEFKKFGTIIDFLPIVLGDGMIRLEVRPQVSSIDRTLGIFDDGIGVPGLRLRQVDTAVEMRAGQTFALAGLVEERTDTVNNGLPYLSDLPVIGVPFRRTQDEINEIELLILVTPEFVDPMDCHETPCGGPGYATTSPTNCQLYCAGHVEVPAHCNPLRGPLACGEDGCMNNCGGGANCGCNQGYMGQGGYGPHGAMSMPGGTGYDDQLGPTPAMTEPRPTTQPSPQMRAVPEDLTLPPPGHSGSYAPATRPGASLPPREPVYQRNAIRPNNRQTSGGAATASGGSLIGPVGYDAE